MYRNAGMNIFLATSRYGQELGSEAIRLLAHQHIRDLRPRTGGLSQGQDHAQLRAHPQRRLAWRTAHGRAPRRVSPL